jgi:hypothetical protein
MLYYIHTYAVYIKPTRLSTFSLGFSAILLLSTDAFHPLACRRTVMQQQQHSSQQQHY